MKWRSVEANNKSLVRWLIRAGILLAQGFILVGLIAEAAPLVERQPSFALSPQSIPDDFFEPLATESPAPTPMIGSRERLNMVRHEDILRDPLDRVSDEFSVPPELQERTAFWFDIYTRYGSTVHVLHHSLYPWIVFDVIDLKQDIDSGKGPRWLRTERAEKKVKARKAEIRLALRSLAKRKNPAPRTELEQSLAERLSSVPGPRRKVYLMAASQLRSQLGQRDFFIQGLRRSSRYLPYMEDIFRQSGLPVDLTRMPFVESSFNEGAESKVGASGIWQIMPATGRAYVNVSREIDERNSPLKATRVAAKLLRSYFHALGSWPLAVTSYNHGIGNIRSAMRAARSHELPTIIKRYHRGDFRFASANFFTCFLAALYAERYSEVAFPSLVREPVLIHDEIRISRAVPIKTLQTLAGLKSSTLTFFNLDLRRANLRRLALPRGYVLLLPPGHAETLARQLKGRVQLIAPPVLTKVGEDRESLPGNKDSSI